MGFLDEMQASLDRTAADAGRALQVNKLKSQMNDALKRRQQLAGQLGASLYEATKGNTELRDIVDADLDKLVEDNGVQPSYVEEAN